MAVIESLEKSQDDIISSSNTRETSQSKEFKELQTTLVALSSHRFKTWKLTTLWKYIYSKG